MNKKELIQQIAHRTGNTQLVTQQFMKVFIDIVTEEVKQENIVALQGFGRFALWEQASRMARNPKTGDQVEILPRKSLKFKPGKNLLEDLNE